MPTFLRLNEIHCLDVILTSGEHKLSWWIRALSGRFIGAQPARFSHVSLALSPSVVAESIGGVGVTLTDLTCTHGPDLDLGSKGDLLYVRRLEDGQLILFVLLPDTGDAEVRRSNAKVPTAGAANSPWQNSAERKNVLAKFSKYVFLNYPAVGKLAGTIGWLKVEIKRWLNDITTKVQGIRNPGPFCSELVFDLIASEAFRAKHFRAIPTPSAFAQSDLFQAIPDAVLQCKESELPGAPAKDWMKGDILRLISRPNLRGVMSKGVTQTILHMGQIMRHEAPGYDWDQFYAVKLKGFQESYIDPIEKFITKGPDPFWSWVNHVNECIKTCPRKKQKRPTFEIEILEAEALREASKPCSSAFRCWSDGPKWDYLSRSFDKFREEELQASTARQASEIKDAAV